MKKHLDEMEGTAEPVCHAHRIHVHVHPPTRTIDAFGRAFARQNGHFEKAIQSLDSLNDQIVQFVFSPQVSDELDDACLPPKQREALESSMALMRKLLMDAQAKFRNMVEDNKQLASRIDGDLQSAHQEVSTLRAELADTNRRISALTGTGGVLSIAGSTTTTTTTTAAPTTIDANGTTTVPSAEESKCPCIRECVSSSSLSSPSSTAAASLLLPDGNALREEISSLKSENEKLIQLNCSLQHEVEELRLLKERMVAEESQLRPKLEKLEADLQHSKEALSSLKTDRKRLKAEKFDLLNQMKQLYGTLEDKEKELRDFIRNYEQRMKDNDESIQQVPVERDDIMQEKWGMVTNAKEETDRYMALVSQLDLKEAQLRQLHEELVEARRQLGYGSDHDSQGSSGGGGGNKLNGFSSLVSTASVAMATPNGRDRLGFGDSCSLLCTLAESTPTDSAYYEGSTVTTTAARSPAITVDSVDTDACSIYASTSVCNNDVDNTLHIHQAGLSRSAEELTHMLGTLGLQKKVPSNPTGTTYRRPHSSKGSTWGSISRVFSRSRSRRSMDAAVLNTADKRTSWSPHNSLCVSPLTEESYSEKLRLLDEAQTLPLDRWKAATVLAWLEIYLGMGQYANFCAENIKSGKVLLELTDAELESGLGISNPMHRKKLRLAIEELRDPRSCKYPRICEMSHTWVCNEWLSGLGLSQYSEIFAHHLVDGRVLDHLTKKELEKLLGVTRKFHQASIVHAIQLLRMVVFDSQTLVERRAACEHSDKDPIVWTNQRFIKWSCSIDLGEYAENLKDSGVHGALVVLEPSFTSDTMATALGVPQSKNIIRRHLTTELESLVQPARSMLERDSCTMRTLSKKDKYPAGSFGRNFSRSYAGGLPSTKSDNRRTSLRGSLTRALGLRLKQDMSFHESPSLPSANSVMSSTGRQLCTNIPTSRSKNSVETHRRIKSSGDIEASEVIPIDGVGSNLI